MPQLRENPKTSKGGDAWKSAKSSKKGDENNAPGRGDTSVKRRSGTGG